MALPKRSEVPVNETWDLTAIYPDKKAWKADMVAVRELVTQFQNNYRSKLTEAKIIIAALHDLETIYQKLSWIEHYAFLPQTTDMTNPEYNQMLVENDNLQAAITADLSFFKTEVLTNPVSLLDQVAEIEPQFAPVVRHWKVEKPHQLSPEVEKTLATLSPTLNSSERIYTTARAADWDMEDFEVDGKTYPMSFVLYENTYQYHPNPEVRHKAHQIFSDTLRKHKNTVAANYYTQVSKEKKLAEIYRILVYTLGEPPVKFDFEYRDSDNNYHIDQDLTPQTFFEKYVNWNLDDYVSIINAPTDDKPYNHMYTIEMLGNVLGEREVRHLNVDMNTFRQVAIKQLESGESVWFGCDVGQESDRKKGIMDTELYHKDELFDVDFSMSKAERLDYSESLMTHAMVLTGVDLVNGTPTKWKVENSWGDKVGTKGFFVMSNNWMEEYCYQVVVNKKFLPEELQKVLTEEPKVLAPWDPMGSLA